MFPTVELLPGEQVAVAVASPLSAPDAVAVLYHQHDKAGNIVVRSSALQLSSYRLVLAIAGAQEPLTIPLMSIRTWKVSVENGPVRDSFRAARQRNVKSTQNGAPSPSPPAVVTSVFVVTINTKHAWTHTIAFAAENKMLLRSLKHHLTACGRLNLIQRLPAFAIGAASPPAKDAAPPMLARDFGWNLLDPQREFARQLCGDPNAGLLAVDGTDAAAEAGVGVDLRPWFHMESLDTGKAGPMEYTFSPTYPTAVLVPNVVPRSVLLAAAGARSRARVPAITYVYLPTGAVLARSSQPLLSTSALPADAALCASFANTGYTTDKRTTVAALAARAAPAPGPAKPAPAVPAASPPDASRAVPPPSLFDNDEDSLLRSRDARRNNASSASPSSPQSQQQRPASATAPFPPVAKQAPRQPAPPPQPPVKPTSAEGTLASGKSLLVADCRPWMSASANAAFGGGYESGPLYDPFCNTQFFEIDNIFGVAKSFDKLRSVLTRYQSDDSKHGNFWRELEDSKWFYHIHRVLVCSVTVAQSLHRGVSALVHCTDGWDRTSQCCATATLLLDPFYRTTVGFCLLLQKDFCHFGHKFAERSEHQVGGRTNFEVSSGVARSDTEKGKGGTSNGGGEGGNGENGGAAGGHKLQPSPIFTQYMDVLYQILHQFPHAFEFTDELLAFLSEAVFSCFFGTFLANCEQERRLEGVERATQSLWSYVLRQVQKEKAGETPLRFLNDRYDAEAAWEGIQAMRAPKKERKGGQTPPMLLPSTSPKRMRFWSDLYCKWELAEFCAEGGSFTREGANGVPPQSLQRPRPRTRVVAYEAEFEAFLQEQIDAACAARAVSEKELDALEALFAKKPARSSGTRRISDWCTFDPTICYECFSASGIFSGLSVCNECGNRFCGNCFHTHLCAGRQGR